MHFFFLPTDAPMFPDTNITKSVKVRPISMYSDLLGSDVNTNTVIANDGVEKHADVIARILFIYAKLNPVVRYVQGMNEVLAPIYY